MPVYKQNSFNIVDHYVSSGLASYANGKEHHLNLYIRAILGVCSMLTNNILEHIQASLRHRNSSPAIYKESLESPELM